MLGRATVERRVRSCLAGRPAGVVAAYLFGSVARGDARFDSDVDGSSGSAGAPVTDPDVVAKKLAVIESSVSELRTLDDLLAFARIVRARLTP